MFSNAFAQGVADSSKYTPCLDYYTVGPSKCAPKASTPLPNVAPQPEAATPAANPAEVQQFLDNYGKPPREFVEFYLNPTPANAQRWVATYREKQERLQALNKAWSEVEAANPVNSAAAPAGAGRATPAPLPQRMPVVVQEPPPVVAVTPAPPQRLGAFATTANDANGQTELTYYFSASCPFCSRLKPDLSRITNQLRSKLKFTCVDVTPLSPRQMATPSNRDGLPCDWRLPLPGEVERLNIRETPTLIVTRLPDGLPTRLRGVIPPAQLEKLLSSN